LRRRIMKRRRNIRRIRRKRRKRRRRKRRRRNENCISTEVSLGTENERFLLLSYTEI
jgi:hypothetical protein